MDNRRRADRVGKEPRRHAAAARAPDLLHGDDAHEAVALGPAVGLREAKAHVADGGGLLVELAREFAGFVPRGAIGLDLALNELAQGLAERFVLRRVERAQADSVERMGGHGRASLFL